MKYLSLGLVYLWESVKILIYHVIPLLSTTIILYLLFTGGLSFIIVLWYLGIVVFCCLLLAISTISGR